MQDGSTRDNHHVPQLHKARSTAPQRELTSDKMPYRRPELVQLSMPQNAAVEPSAPRPEAVAAANWWAQQLEQPPLHGLGAREQTNIANAATAVGRTQKTPEQVEAFRTALAEVIEQELSERPEDWRPGDPSFASAFRAIAGDYRPARELETAAERAGFKLKMFDVPMKTVMWVNPGVVTVAVGHGGITEVVWREGQ